MGPPPPPPPPSLNGEMGSRRRRQYTNIVRKGLNLDLIDEVFIFYVNLDRKTQPLIATGPPSWGRNSKSQDIGIRVQPLIKTLVVTKKKKVIVGDSTENPVSC